MEVERLEKISDYDRLSAKSRSCIHIKTLALTLPRGSRGSMMGGKREGEEWGKRTGRGAYT